MNRTNYLIDRVHNGDKSSEDILVKENMPLVHSCARRLRQGGTEYDDLVQIGSIGLIKAIRRFDSSLGYMFSTYAVPLIMGEIKRFLRDDGIIKVSRSMKEANCKAMSARESLMRSLGREPTVGEIAEFLNTDTESLIISMDACRPCESLQRPISEEDGITLGDTVKSDFSFADEIEILALKSAIDDLDVRERKIMILRYFKGKTQSEISNIIGVSQVQISRIEKRVISKLRKRLS